MHTYVRLEESAGPMYVGDFSRDEVLARLRADAERNLAQAQRTLRLLDDDKVTVEWIDERFRRHGPPEAND